VHVSNLRKALGGEAIDLTSAGYVLHVTPEALDATTFADLVSRARAELAAGHADVAATLAGEALELWRGPPLDEFEPEALPRAQIGRLEEAWLTGFTTRAEAAIELGDHAIVADLAATAGDHPYDERLHELLMIALYRSGRPADALGAYQAIRTRLADDLGLEPSPSLRETQRRILAHDPGLTPEPPSTRVVVVAPETPASLPELAHLAAPLAHARFPHELILASLARDRSELDRASAGARALVEDLDVSGVRTSSFVTEDRAADLLHLAHRADVDLVLLAVESDCADAWPPWLELVLGAAICDVAFIAGRPPQPIRSAVVVPFGAREHDWAALELGAWLASSSGLRLVLVGADAESGSRDPSRMLADAGLLLQRLTGVEVEPRLVAPGAEGLASAAGADGLLVMGLSDRWSAEGLGALRREVARLAAIPPLFAKRGFRPGGVSSPLDLTRYRWSAGAS
jgi:hypothetical protein